MLFAIMEAVQKYIGVDSLMKVMRLSKKFRNRKLEMIIFPIEEHEEGFIFSIGTGGNFELML